MHEKQFMMKRFALIGAAGFIAPRHLKAIKDNNGELIAAMDKFDSVGILDHYFPQTKFFNELERFERFLNKMKHTPDQQIDFLSVCTPNYLHDSHIRLGLQNNLNVIAEKPLVLNPWNLDALSAIEHETGKKIYSILQLRHHPEIIALKNKVEKENENNSYCVDITYVTFRGDWYQRSWKGDIEKSGGIATNIGIHFFDMLCWIFGEVKENIVEIHTDKKAKGYLAFSRAKVTWFLSTDESDLPESVRNAGGKNFRNLVIDGEAIDFTNGFNDLHTASYEQIINGGGFGLEVVRPSIEIVHQIRAQSNKLK